MKVDFRIATLGDVAELDRHPTAGSVDCNHGDEIADKHNTYLVAALSGSIVVHGYVRWTGFRTEEVAVAFPGCVVLNSLYVWPESMQRRGIGTQTIAYFEALVSDEGRDRIGLGVYTDNVSAQRLYESLGYEFWDGGVLTYSESGKSWTVMTKSLS